MSRVWYSRAQSLLRTASTSTRLTWPILFRRGSALRLSSIRSTCRLALDRLRKSPQRLDSRHAKAGTCFLSTLAQIRRTSREQNGSPRSSVHLVAVVLPLVTIKKLRRTRNLAKRRQRTQRQFRSDRLRPRSSKSKSSSRTESCKYSIR